MKKLIVALIVSLALVGCCSKNESSKKNIKIGIIQIVEHAELDNTRRGFIDGLKELGYVEGENLTIDYQNAAGEVINANTIATGFVTDEVDLIFAVATQSALSAANATDTIPVVFSAVTDPISAKIVESLEKPGKNVTGTIDAVDINKQFALIQELVPTAKKVGILYNTSEVNSIVQVEQAKEAASTYGYEIIAQGVTSTNELAAAPKILTESADVIYLPTDNLIYSAAPTILDVTNTANKPVFAAAGSVLEQGALATDGIVYYELGKQSAKMAVDIIEGKNPGEMPIEKLKETQIVINETVASKLGITIPTELAKKAELMK